jgi:hypothetical protein
MSVLIALLIIIIVLLLVVVGLLLARSPSKAITRGAESPTPTVTSSPVRASPKSPSPTGTGSSHSSPSRSGSASADEPPTPTPSSPQYPPGGSQLPVGGTFLGDPVDDAESDASSGVDSHISGVDYSYSATLGCPLAADNVIDWDVAGYRTFMAMVGIADNESGALRETATVTFFDQDKHLLGTAKVSLDHPQPVKLTLNGANRLQVTCTISPASSTVFDLSLGNGALIR